MKTGWSTATMLAELIAAASGAYVTPLDHEYWADRTELALPEVQAAFAYLVEEEFGYIEDGHLILYTPRRRRELAAAEVAAAERAAAQATKVALRGGQVGRKAIPAQVRMAVMERDGHRCVLCSAAEDLTLDHIHPWSLGGPDTVENLRVLCRSCNSRKGDRT